jgi:hypothetical protein
MCYYSFFPEQSNIQILLYVAYAIYYGYSCWSSKVLRYFGDQDAAAVFDIIFGRSYLKNYLIWLACVNIQDEKVGNGDVRQWRY